MKRSTQTLIVVLAATGLTLSGCDILFPDEDPVEEEPEVEEPVVLEDEEEEEEEDEEDEVAIDEDMFILAAFELACVEQEIEDEEQAEEIQGEIYARYGLDEDSFEAAEEEYGDEENVELALETRMEACDEEMAESFADEGAGELEEEEDEEADEEADEGDEPAAAAQPAPRPEPAQTGTLTANIRGGDFEDTTLTLRVRRDFNLSGDLRGSAEGRNFMIPISGEVSEDGSIDASGDRGGNTVNVTGQLSSSSAEGALSGEVHQNSYRVRYQAR